ncbi:MAG: hypothetical protein EZS28_055401, partial [Streblomastix strix]
CQQEKMNEVVMMEMVIVSIMLEVKEDLAHLINLDLNETKNKQKIISFIPSLEVEEDEEQFQKRKGKIKMEKELQEEIKIKIQQLEEMEYQKAINEQLDVIIEINMNKEMEKEELVEEEMIIDEEEMNCKQIQIMNQINQMCQILLHLQHY